MPHFNFTFNKDGTISPEDEDDLVWGLADPSPCSKFNDIVANLLGWTLTREEKKKAEKEEEERLRLLIDTLMNQKLAGMQKIIQEQGEMIKDLQDQVIKK